MSIRGKYPILADALADMARRWALHRKNAKKIARKANLVSGGTLSRPRTVFDAYFHPMEQANARQWLTDLTGMSRVSFVSRSSAPCYLLCYTAVSEDFSPTYTPFYDEDLVGVSAEATDGGPNWVNIPEFQQTVIRLTISTSPEAVNMDPDAYSGPFSVALQAAP